APLTAAEPAAHLLFRGRYFMDISKLAHIAAHFPSQQPHMFGTSIFGVPVAVPESVKDVLPERTDAPSGWNAIWGGSNSLPGEIVRVRLNNYLGTYVFREPLNGVTNFAGGLYIDFSYYGVAAI